AAVDIDAPPLQHDALVVARRSPAWKTGGLGDPGGNRVVVFPVRILGPSIEPPVEQTFPAVRPDQECGAGVAGPDATGRQAVKGDAPQLDASLCQHPPGRRLL